MFKQVFAFAALLVLGTANCLAIDKCDKSELPSPDVLNEFKHNTEVTCIALAIYFESQSEPDEGQEAVAWSVVTRMYSGNHPDSTCDVVLEKNQYSWVNDGKCNYPNVNTPAWAASIALAEFVWRNQERLALPILYFANHDIADKNGSEWIKNNGDYLFKIGNHWFYSERETLDNWCVANTPIRTVFLHGTVQRFYSQYCRPLVKQKELMAIRNEHANTRKNDASR